MPSKAAITAELAAVLITEWHTEFNRMTLRAWMKQYGNDTAAPTPAKVAADALALLRIGAGVASWAVRACNGEGHRDWTSQRGGFWAWDETDDAAKEKADKRATDKADEILSRYGARCEIGGDPRGYTFRLILASGRTNTIGRDGWGVA